MLSIWQRYKRNYTEIIRLGLPILVGQVGMIVVGFADNIMLGRYSTAALASASLVNNLFNTAVLACLGFTYGLTPLVGALFSRKRPDEIGALMRNALLVNTIFALAVTLVMWIIYLNIEILDQPTELLPLIKPYYKLSLAGLLAISLFNVFGQWAYAINRTALPMWIILSANLVNIAGNYALIFGNCGAPELGLVGAGISTLTARWLCPAVIIYIFFTANRFKPYRDGFADSRQTKRLWWKINRTSWPVALQMIFETGSFSATAVMAGWIGAISLAAFQVIMTVGSLGFMVYYSLGSAVSVLVANAAGVADTRQMRQTAFAGYHIILFTALVASLIFLFGGRQLAWLFSDDPLVIEATVALIFPLILYQLGDATQATFANALRGTSHVTPMMWIAGFSYLIVGIPAAWILAFPLGLSTYGIVLSYTVSLAAAALLYIYFFMRSSRATPSPGSRR